MSEQAKQELFDPAKPIVAFDPFRKELAELKKLNDSLVFDYHDPKGEKEARSHIYKLRQTRSAVDRVRKDNKQSALEYGRRVDSEAKEIANEITQMIDAHQGPLDEIERKKEEARQRRDAVTLFLREAPLPFDEHNDPLTVEGLEARIAEVEAVELEEALFEGLYGDAIRLKEAALNKLRQHLDAAKQKREQEKELARLREEKEKRKAEEAARLAQEREKKLQEEAAKAAREKAEREAAEKIAAAKAAEEKAIKDAAEAKERAKGEAKEAEERAKQRAAEAAERAKREAEEAERDRKEQARLEIQKREADRKIRQKVHDDIVKYLAPHLGKSNAVKAANLLISGDVPHVRIEF